MIFCIINSLTVKAFCSLGMEVRALKWQLITVLSFSSTLSPKFLHFTDIEDTNTILQGNWISELKISLHPACDFTWDRAIVWQLWTEYPMPCWRLSAYGVQVTQKFSFTDFIMLFWGGEETEKTPNLRNRNWSSFTYWGPKGNCLSIFQEKCILKFIGNSR